MPDTPPATPKPTTSWDAAMTADRDAASDRRRAAEVLFGIKPTTDKEESTTP
ncbi:MULTISPECIES: hypothetical protein [unclassified Rathayibacter]|uniref:hypothetical protein n=1 Tax=unclassified Rathayibacter TaxID=2609250 RepID=UPI000A8F719F|nr:MULTISPECIES: hypothetical protein [unclassified Rathayibacter]